MKEKIKIIVVVLICAICLSIVYEKTKSYTTIKTEANGIEIEKINKDGSVSKIDEEEIAKDNEENNWIPKNIKKVYSINKPNEEIRDLIANYYDIPREDYKETRYYYNYSDLDGDGIDDVFVVIVGPYTSGTGGSSALWLKNNNGKFEIKQGFTLVNTPILIEGGKNDKKSLIMKRSGGGAKEELVKMNLVDNIFENVADAKPIESLDNCQGKAIICNDLAEDVDNENALTLDK